MGGIGDGRPPSLPGGTEGGSGVSIPGVRGLGSSRGVSFGGGSGFGFDGSSGMVIPETRDDRSQRQQNLAARLTWLRCRSPRE